MDLEDKKDAISEMEDPTILDVSEIAFDDIDELRSTAPEAVDLREEVTDLESEVEELEGSLDGVDEARLAELRDRDDPVVLESDRFDELTSLESELSALFADELSAHSPFESEELADRFGPMELYNRVEESDDVDLVSELGDAEDHARSGDTRDDEAEELAADEADETELDGYVEELRQLGFDEQLTRSSPAKSTSTSTSNAL
jgi:hypothetical protein